MGAKRTHTHTHRWWIVCVCVCVCVCLGDETCKELPYEGPPYKDMKNLHFVDRNASLHYVDRGCTAPHTTPWRGSSRTCVCESWRGPYHGTPRYLAAASIKLTSGTPPPPSPDTPRGNHGMVQSMPCSIHGMVQTTAWFIHGCVALSIR
jgi:hypothetical protein